MCLVCQEQDLRKGNYIVLQFDFEQFRFVAKGKLQNKIV